MVAQTCQVEKFWRSELESGDQSEPFVVQVQGPLQCSNMHSPTFYRLFLSHFWHLVEYQKFSEQYICTLWVWDIFKWSYKFSLFLFFFHLHNKN